MIFNYHSINAQNNIIGIIRDQDSIPLPGATIYIPDLNKGTVANNDGNYIISNLPNGKTRIQYSYIGFINQVVTIELNQEERLMNITLIPTAVEAGEIIISGGYNSTQHGNAVKVDVLKLNPHSIKSTPNFSEVLTRVPGVDMISKGSGVSKPVIRGLSMNDILVLNNGVRFENYQYSSHHPLGIDEFGIENVEIIKGPASLLYGSDAVGGVINFIKEKPAPVGTVEGDYNMQLFSNTLGMSNNFGIKGASGKLFGGIRAGHKSNSDFLQGGSDFVPNSRFNEFSVKMNAGYTGRAGTTKLFYDYSNQKLGLVEDEAIEQVTERARKNSIWYQEFNTHLLSLMNKFYFGKSRLEINSAYQSTGLIHFGEADIREIEMRLATLTYESILHLPSNEISEYIIGFQGLNQSNKNLKNLGTILLPDATTNNYSLFTLLQYTILTKLKLQTGLRYDKKSIATESVGLPSDIESYRQPINKYYGSLSGSLGATFTYNEDLLLRSNFAAAYRTPNLAELTSNGPHELRFEKGDGNLVPENSREIDLSFHYHIDNLIFDISVFYNKINNYIFIAPTGDTTITGMSIYNYNQTDSYLYGCETGLHFHPERYEWLHIETVFSFVIGKQKDGEYLPFIPAHKIQFELRAEKEKLNFLQNVFVYAKSAIAFNQNRSAADETETRGYSLFDIGTGGEIKVTNQNIQVSINVNNILDTKYIDHLSTLKEVGLYNPGRNFTLNLKIPFSCKRYAKINDKSQQKT
jgi:iron complex outermembrane receptor protein